MGNEIMMDDKSSKPAAFRIGSRWIGDKHPVFVIAEIGINHEGDPDTCMRMVEEAARAGADAVKLQIVDADESYVQGSVSHQEFSNKSLSDQALFSLGELADKLDIVLFSTPGDFSSLDQMCQQGMPAVKISSGLMTNLPLIVAAAQKGLPMIISTGMAYGSEVNDAVNSALSEGASGVAILKCTALYPAPDESLNLNAIPAMAARYGVPVGYSDHTLDDLACLAAVANGATVIEKHFTLDSSLPGADHHISMEPAPFAEMISKIRRLERMRGNGAIEPADAEVAVRSERHRCLVARVDIPAGSIFSKENLALKRPLQGSVGLPPSAYATVLGKFVRENIGRDEPISAEHVGEL